MTLRGACDPTYNFDVNISNGIVSHPNLVKLRGRVIASGLVRASITVQDKRAAGSGRLIEELWQGQLEEACTMFWILDGAEALNTVVPDALGDGAQHCGG